MNVIMMGKFPYPHGMAATKRVQHFIDYLKDHKISVKLILLRQINSGKSKSCSLGAHEGVPYLKIGNDLKLSATVLFKLSSYLLNGTRYLSKWRQRGAKNILYIYGGPSIENIWFIVFAKLCGFKTVFDIVEDYSTVAEKLPALTRIKLMSFLLAQKNIQRLCNGLVVISQHLKIKYLRRTKNKIPVQLIPISAAIRSDDKKIRLNSPTQIVYSGSFATKDDVESLIDAFADVYRSNKKIRLILTGMGEKKNVSRIQKKIENLPGITYHGYLADDAFYQFLDNADILCMVRKKSKYANAGFPFKLGEYLATGNPVIASDVGDVRFYLQSTKDAMIVTPESSKDLRKAIEYLIKDPEEAIRIGRSGKAKCSQHFDPRRNGSLLLGLFNAL